jgi:transposase
MGDSLESLPNDVDALKAALLAERGRRIVAETDAAFAKARASDDQALIAHLKLQIEKLNRDRYGPRSERTARLLDQLELTLEELEASATEDELAAEMAAARTANATTTVASFTRKRPSRQPFPDHLPRERVIVPGPTACLCCGGERLRKLGETVTETLESIPRQWKVIQHVREKFTCRDCEKISQAPAPFHVIARGWAGPSLLAMVLFEKFGQHQPLNRQAERYAREGVPISLSTLADQVGGCTAALMPLFKRLEAHVMSAERLHGDDTWVPVLAKGKTDTGRIWVYVRDDKPFGGPEPPGAVFYYSRDRAGEHPQAHLANYSGIFQADAYGGYTKLYEGGRTPGPILEAACWVHYLEHSFIWSSIVRSSGICGEVVGGTHDKIRGPAGRSGDSALASRAWSRRARCRRASRRSGAHLASSSGWSRGSGSWSRCWNVPDNRGLPSRRFLTAAARQHSYVVERAG